MKKTDRQALSWLKRDKGSVSESDLARLKAGEPLAYVIGWAPFLNCRIGLARKPLIPRPETEYWTEKAIGEMKVRGDRIRVLDLYAGSGCVGIAVLKNIRRAEVTFAEREENALKEIRSNLKLNRIRGRAKVVRSDSLAGVRGQFDFILANPPYIPAGRKLPASVNKFEPPAALYGGPDGLLFFRVLARELPRFLGPGGVAYLEFGAGQKKELERIFRKFTVREFHRDQYGRWRYVRISTEPDLQK